MYGLCDRAFVFPERRFSPSEQGRRASFHVSGAVSFCQASRRSLCGKRSPASCSLDQIQKIESTWVALRALRSQFLRLLGNDADFLQEAAICAPYRRGPRPVRQDAFWKSCRLPMSNYSPAMGRRKVVEKFTVRQGLWTLDLPVAILMGILLLLLFGYLNADMH
jgi:hypothetical protein